MMIVTTYGSHAGTVWSYPNLHGDVVSLPTTRVLVQPGMLRLIHSGSRSIR